jgi:hypothetical protein
MPSDRDILDAVRVLRQFERERPVAGDSESCKNVADWLDERIRSRELSRTIRSVARERGEPPAVTRRVLSAELAKLEARKRQ